MNFWNANTTGAGPLTQGEWDKAVGALMDPNHPINQPHPCTLGQHLISYTAKKRGYGICIECRMPVGVWPVGQKKEEDS